MCATPLFRGSKAVVPVVLVVSYTFFGLLMRKKRDHTRYGRWPRGNPRWSWYSHLSSLRSMQVFIRGEHLVRLL